MNSLKLNSLPESIGQLSTLQRLHLAWNELESLPSSLAYCRRSLTFLNVLSNANLKMLPQSFEFLYLINVIDIRRTSINPEDVAALKVKWAAANGIDTIQLLHIR